MIPLRQRFISDACFLFHSFVWPLLLSAIALALIKSEANIKSIKYWLDMRTENRFSERHNNRLQGIDSLSDCRRYPTNVFNQSQNRYKIHFLLLISQTLSENKFNIRTKHVFFNITREQIKGFTRNAMTLCFVEKLRTSRWTEEWMRKNGKWRNVENFVPIILMIRRLMSSLITELMQLVANNESDCPLCHYPLALGVCHSVTVRCAPQSCY